MNDVRYYDKQFDTRQLNKTSLFLYETERIEIAFNKCSKAVYDNDLLFVILHALCCGCNIDKSYNWSRIDSDTLKLLY
jgi:hypothetical protein